MPSWLEHPGGGATLFLAGEDHGRCEKAKRTRRYLLGHRRILKKGRLYHTPRKSNFSKGKRRLEMQYFKTAILRRKAEFNGLVVSASTVATKKKRADKPFAYWLRVIGSASVRLALLQS